MPSRRDERRAGVRAPQSPTALHPGDSKAWGRPGQRHPGVDVDGRDHRDRPDRPVRDAVPPGHRRRGVAGLLADRPGARPAVAPSCPTIVAAPAGRGRAIEIASACPRPDRDRPPRPRPASALGGGSTSGRGPLDRSIVPPPSRLFLIPRRRSPREAGSRPAASRRRPPASPRCGLAIGPTGGRRRGTATAPAWRERTGGGPAPEAEDRA